MVVMQSAWHNFITVAIIVHAVVVAFDLTADHLLFDIVGIKVFFFNVVNDHAVAQNRQGAALFIISFRSWLMIITALPASAISCMMR